MIWWDHFKATVGHVVHKLLRSAALGIVWIQDLRSGLVRKPPHRNTAHHLFGGLILDDSSLGLEEEAGDLVQVHHDDKLHLDVLAGLPTR